MRISVSIDTKDLPYTQKEFVEALSETELQQYLTNLLRQNSDTDLILGLLLDIREKVFEEPKQIFVPTQFNNEHMQFNNISPQFNNESALPQQENTNANVQTLTLKDEVLDISVSERLKKIRKMKGGKK